MRYDTIIIGGGLSGLTCGIALAKGGQRVAVIGAGQSTLHFNSGSISLLGYDAEGNTVASPLEAMEQLPATPPTIASATRPHGPRRPHSCWPRLD